MAGAGHHLGFAGWRMPSSGAGAGSGSLRRPLGPVRTGVSGDPVGRAADPGRVVSIPPGTGGNAAAAAGLPRIGPAADQYMACWRGDVAAAGIVLRSEEHTDELQSLM